MDAKPSNRIPPFTEVPSIPFPSAFRAEGISRGGSSILSLAIPSIPVLRVSSSYVFRSLSEGTVFRTATLL